MRTNSRGPAVAAPSEDQYLAAATRIVVDALTEQLPRCQPVKRRQAQRPGAASPLRVTARGIPFTPRPMMDVAGWQTARQEPGARSDGAARAERGPGAPGIIAQSGISTPRPEQPAATQRVRPSEGSGPPGPPCYRVATREGRGGARRPLGRAIDYGAVWSQLRLAASHPPPAARMGDGKQAMEAAAPRKTRALFTLAWYRTLSPNGRVAFVAACAGYALAGFDLLSFTFVLARLRVAFGLTEAQVGALVAVTLGASVVGGMAGGVLADRFGRARILQWSVGAYALFSLLSGLAQSYEQFLLTRLLLGVGFGAEWTAGALLVAEYAAPAQRGRAQGVYAAALSVGDAVAALAYLSVSLLVPGDLAWRVLLGLGVLPALLIFWVRTRVVDPPIYRAARQTSRGSEHAAPPRGALRLIFLPPLLLATTGGALLASGILGGKYIVNIWLPAYLQQTRALTGFAAGAPLAAVLVGAILGSVLAGYCQDGLGRRPTFLLYSVASALAYGGYLLVPQGAAGLLLLVGLPLGFCTAGALSGLGAYLAELYPTGNRGAGQGFTYSVGRGASGLVTGGIGYLVPWLGLSGAIAVGASSYLLALVALLVLPETRGRDLAAKPAAPAPVTRDT
jgi:MFS family permease